MFEQNDYFVLVYVYVLSQMQDIFPAGNTPSLTRSANHTSQLNGIVDHVVELIELTGKPHVQHDLVLADKLVAAGRKDLGALLQVVDVVDTEKGEASVCFGIVLSRVSYKILCKSSEYVHRSSAAGRCWGR